MVAESLSYNWKASASGTVAYLMLDHVNRGSLDLSGDHAYVGKVKVPVAQVYETHRASEFLLGKTRASPVHTIVWMQLRDRNIMALGTVKFFNVSKGFGFISPEGGGGDIFVHVSAFQSAEIQTLVEGQRVKYSTESDTKGLKVTKLDLIALEGVGHSSRNQSAPERVASKDLALTIYHNPECATSRNVLMEIQAAGYEPRIVEYLKVPFTREELKSIAGRMQLPVRDLARKTELLFGQLRLDERDVGENEILDAMIEHPILVNRPIVTTHNAARLCRPSGLVKGFLVEVAQA